MNFKILKIIENHHKFFEKMDVSYITSDVEISISAMKLWIHASPSSPIDAMYFRCLGRAFVKKINNIDADVGAWTRALFLLFTVPSFACDKVQYFSMLDDMMELCTSQEAFSYLASIFALPLLYFPMLYVDETVAVSDASLGRMLHAFIKRWKPQRLGALYVRELASRVDKGKY